jgi:glycine/D-amino acid oxidase-like deaminating enzyme
MERFQDSPVIVVGAGIVGCSIAVHLPDRPRPSTRNSSSSAPTVAGPGAEAGAGQHPLQGRQALGQPPREPLVFRRVELLTVDGRPMSTTLTAGARPAQGRTAPAAARERPTGDGPADPLDAERHRAEAASDEPAG